MTLNDVCHVITCGVAKRPEYVESGVPFLSSKNVKADRFILDHYNYVSLEDFHALTKHNKPENGDILYTRVGSFGEAAVISLNFEFAIFVSLTLLKPKQDIVHDRFLMHYLNSPKIRNLAINSTSGIGVQNLNVNAVRKFPINLPPLPIQRKIAEVLDAADRIRQRNKDILAKYDQLAQSVFLEMFGDPVKNEKGWEVKSLKEVTTKIGSGSTPRGGKDSYQVEGISLIRSLNIHDGFFKYDNLAYINYDQADKLKNVIIEEGDVLFNITGASVCRCAIVPPEIIPARVNQHVAILRPGKKLASQYLAHLMISVNTKIQLLDLASKGGATREAITKDDLENYLIPLPPFHLQNQFTTIIKNIEQQKAKAQAELNKSEELFQSLMQRAFKGELTFQE